MLYIYSLFIFTIYVLYSDTYNLVIGSMLLTILKQIFFFKLYNAPSTLIIIKYMANICLLKVNRCFVV